MNKLLISSLIGFVALAGCDGKNPFMVEEEVIADTGETELIDINDPNTDVNNKFAYDPAASLTMNSVVFDDNGTPGITSDDTLIINNLPFDGPDGIYDEFVTGNGVRVFASRQTATTGIIQHYAVFLRTDHLEATAAAGRDWNSFGNAGANINRDSFALPGGVGEYVYTGTYGGTRTFSDRSGIEVSTGVATIILDVLDFDPVDGFQGDIVGTITDRERLNADGTDGRELPDIVLAEVSFNTVTGIWEGGDVGTVRPLGGALDSGTYDGMIAGNDGSEIGGYLVMQGAADVQLVTYQVVVYRTVNEIPILDAFGNPLLDPISGDPVVQQIFTTGTSSGLDTVSIEALNNLINTPGGADLPDYLPAPGVPTGPNVEILSNENLEIEIQTDYDAQEVGVFVAEQL